MNNVFVFKFGGASVKDVDGIKNLAKIIDLNRGKQLLIVVSAMGKTTNKLEELTHSYFSKKPDSGEIFIAAKAYHENIIDELFTDKKHPIFDIVSNTFLEIEWMLEEEPHEDFGFVYDQIVSIGELVSTRIVSAYLNFVGLNNQWMDARNFIHTDNTYQEGKVNWEKTCHAVQQQIPALLSTQYIVTQGFIGGTSENYTTTLGREGSDYSAAIFASCLNARSVTIWKDVPGILNADPKFFPDTIKYDELSYIEALEMTYYGATVIHPKTIKPLQNADIPLLVKPFGSPNDSGTIINKSSRSANDIPAIIIKKDQILISISTKDLSFISEEYLSDIFKIFAQYRIKINAMQISAISFTVCFDQNEMSVRKAVRDLEKQYDLKYNTELKLITVRNYTDEILDRLTANGNVLLKQLSRNTAQLVIKQWD